MTEVQKQQRKLHGFYHPVQSPDEFWSNLAKLRREAEVAIDRLIQFVDLLDAPSDDREYQGDEEEEPEGEPSLGSFDRALNQERWSARGGTCAWDVDLEDDHADDEPSLGSTDSLNQERWAAGGRDDREDDPAEMGIGDEDGLQEQLRPLPFI